MSRVAIVFTGGTISTLPNAAAGGNTPVLDGAAILARAPELSAIAELEAIDWGLMPASHLRFAQLIDIARVLDEQLARPQIDGAVVVQGTDTIEETAFAFELLLRSDKPVAVTGAMRDSSSPDYDGSRNLADAVGWVISNEHHGRGVAVVMGGAVIPARTAVKTDTAALDTFRPRDATPAVDRERRQRLPKVPAAAIEDVHLVTATVGMDGTLLRALRPTHPRGIVIAATGSGNTSADLLEAARDLMGDGTLVALTTRCPTGTVAPTYAFPGGGATWQQAGALMSSLDGPKTRVALALGLAAGLAREQMSALLGA